MPHARFAKIRAVGAALGIETLPIEKNQGEKIAMPATAYAGIRSIPSPIPVQRA